MPTTEPAVLPDWCTVGATVYENHRGAVYHERVVTKITATQVVTTNPEGGSEQRFRRAGLASIGGGTWNTTTLVACDNPRVAAYLDDQRRNAVAHKVTDLMLHLRRDDDVEAAQEAVALLTAYLAARQGSS